VPNCKSFLVTEAERKHVRRRAMETRAVKFSFNARQGAEGNSRYSDRNMRGTCTIVCHRPRLSGPV